MYSRSRTHHYHVFSLPNTPLSQGKWAILFSHPADFTPVCTTEIGRLALKYDELTDLDCKVATLSVDPVKSHQEWLSDVVAHCENEIEVKFPIIADPDRSISIKYGMIDPGNLDEQELPLTIRAVFIINPENKLMLSLNYRMYQYYLFGLFMVKF